MNHNPTAHAHPCLLCLPQSGRLVATGRVLFSLVPRISQSASGGPHDIWPIVMFRCSTCCYSGLQPFGQSLAHCSLGRLRCSPWVHQVSEPVTRQQTHCRIRTGLSTACGQGGCSAPVHRSVQCP